MGAAMRPHKKSESGKIATNRSPRQKTQLHSGANAHTGPVILVAHCRETVCRETAIKRIRFEESRARLVPHEDC
jgi:hypothetical protein